MKKSWIQGLVYAAVTGGCIHAFLITEASWGQYDSSPSARWNTIDSIEKSALDERVNVPFPFTDPDSATESESRISAAPYVGSDAALYQFPDEYNNEYNNDRNVSSYSLDYFDTNRHALREPSVLNRPDSEKAEPSFQGRDGVFQKASGKVTFLTAGGGAQSLGMTTAYADLVLGLPCPTRTMPLLLTPYFQADCMNYGNWGTGLPETLYRTGLNIAWMRPLGERWGVYAFASPCVSSDFHARFKNGFRCPFGVIANWTIDSAWKVSMGAVYSDNCDWLVVPACGITWTPNELWKVELIVPRPRVCRRIGNPIYWKESCPADPRMTRKTLGQYWVYLAGEYQGGIWAIDSREFWIGQNDDDLQYRDLRVLFGFEKDPLYAKGINCNAELGIAFCRKVYFDKCPAVYHPNPSLVARVQVQY